VHQSLSKAGWWQRHLGGSYGNSDDILCCINIAMFWSSFISQEILGPWFSVAIRRAILGGAGKTMAPLDVSFLVMDSADLWDFRGYYRHLAFVRSKVKYKRKSEQ
jgi:hypothetical protein